MKKVKYLASLLCGVLVYVFLSITCGQNGVWALNQLTEQKRVISANTAKIQSINDELNLEKTAIRDDPDVIAAYARKLDYIFEGERLVKINGFGDTFVHKYDTGTVIKSHKVQYVPEAFCKGAGILVGLLLAFFMFLYDLSYGLADRITKPRVETVEGIPVYDVAQV